VFAAAAGPDTQGRVVVGARSNDLGQSAVAAYSLRARAGLPVSMPIAWSDLGDVDLRGGHFGIDGVPAFVAARRDDPWAAYEQSRRTLSAAMRRALVG
jgi:bifunctional non-homologous end joining protein LigD